MTARSAPLSSRHSLPGSKGFSERFGTRLLNPGGKRRNDISWGQSSEKTMTCAICKTGKMKPGMVTVTFQRGDTTVVIKKVPAELCDNCGEYYLDDAVAEWVYSQAENASARSAEVEVLQYAA